MVVIDGSALAIGVVDTSERGDQVRAWLEDGAVGPHLVDAEVGEAIRGLVLRGALDEAEAERSLVAAGQLVVDRFPHLPLRPRAWELRNNVSYYDALYVALAEAAGLSLVTTDAKLAKARGPRCSIELL